MFNYFLIYLSLEVIKFMAKLIGSFLVFSILFISTFSSIHVYAADPKNEPGRIDIQQISLKKLLRDLGYGFFSIKGVPLAGETEADVLDNVEAGMLGVPNSEVEIGRFEWPFSGFTASSDLSLIAFGFNEPGFPRLTRQQSKGKIAIVNLPDNDRQEASLLQLYDFALRVISKCCGLLV